MDTKFHRLIIFQNAFPFYYVCRAHPNKRQSAKQGYLALTGEKIKALLVMVWKAYAFLAYLRLLMKVLA